MHKSLNHLTNRFLAGSFKANGHPIKLGVKQRTYILATFSIILRSTIFVATEPFNVQTKQYFASLYNLWFNNKLLLLFPNSSELTRLHRRQQPVF